MKFSAKRHELFYDAILDIFMDVKLLADASINLKYSSLYVCQKLEYSVMCKWTKTSSEHEIPLSRFGKGPVALTIYRKVVGIDQILKNQRILKNLMKLQNIEHFAVRSRGRECM